MADRYFGAHELQQRDEAVKTASDRSFGFVFAAVCTLVAAIGAFRGGQFWPLWLAAAALFLAAALAKPGLLKPLNRAWTAFGLLLHAVVSPAILAGLFYLCITPIGFLMRLAGKDPLRLRRDAAAASYWIPREPPGPAPDSFKNQF